MSLDPRDELANLTIEKIKRDRVADFDGEKPNPINKWSVYRCLVGSLDHHGQQYALNEGAWYSVDEAFKQATSANYDHRVIGFDAAFTPLIKTYPEETARKIHIETEGAYLRRIADASGYFLMDQKLVQVPDTRGPGIEVCDMLDVEGKRLIHVKKGSSHSSALSHLFRQGANSAQLLRSSSDFRQHVIERIQADSPETAARFEAEFQRGIDWTVEFRIIDEPRVGGGFDIPFFSKLSFRDAVRRGEAMSYNYRIGFIRQ